MNMSLYPSIEVPTEVRLLQEWFATIISQPLIGQNQINPISPKGASIVEEAACYISPGPKLKSYQCLEIYNQQFWLRLLNVMEKNFPLTSRILGNPFKEIAKEYLLGNFPNHWALTYMGKEFPKWIKNHYHGINKELVCHSAQIDWIFYSCFISKRLDILTRDVFSRFDGTAQYNVNFCLQPYIFLVKYPYDLPIFRETIIQYDCAFWHANSIPSLTETDTHYFVIFRNYKNIVSWKKISLAEFLLIKRFNLGSSILNVCNWIEKQDEDLKKIMVEKFQTWIQNWITLGWFVLADFTSTN